MHYTCVPVSGPGGGQICPICKDAERLADETTHRKRPYAHEAEVGAKLGRRARAHPEMGAPPFPAVRKATAAEARLHGYESVEAWYIDFRLEGRVRTPEEVAKLRAEFKQLQLTLAKDDSSDKRK